MKDKIAIIGAGGHGRVCADIAKLCGYKEIVFLDDGAKDFSGEYKVAGKISDFEKYINEYDFFIGIGTAEIRKKFFEMTEKSGAQIVSLIHPNAVLGSSVKVKKGVVIMAGAVINTGTVLGKGVIVNTCASVDHDCAVEEFSHISVGAHVCGTVSIGKNVWLGAGSTVINNIKICDDCFIGAGAVVVKNIEKTGTYIGVPAKIKN